MIYTLILLSPRFALLGLAGVYVACDFPWIALFPLAVFIMGWGSPKVGA